MGSGREDEHAVKLVGRTPLGEPSVPLPPELAGGFVGKWANGFGHAVARCGADAGVTDGNGEGYMIILDFQRVEAEAHMRDATNTIRFTKTLDWIVLFRIPNLMNVLKNPIAYLL